MSPKREENVKTLTGLSSQKDEFEFPDCNEAAILEISSLLGTDAETLLLYLVISKNGDLEEGVLSPARLKARFHAMNANYSVLHCKEYISRHLGLDSLAREAWNYITSKCLLEDNHLDMIDWAVLFVQDLLRYSLLPENVFGKFPYQESTVNSWFKQPKERDETSGEVNVLNRIEKKQKQDEPYPLLDEKDFPQGIELDGYKLLYHGTDHNSAVSILEDGIDLSKGNDHMDFSHGKGFYLNNNFQEARRWAFHRRNKKRAVLIFKIPITVLDEFRGDSISLLEDEDEWQRITYHFRTDPSKRFMKEMRQRRISFIEGAIASVSVRDRGLVKIKGPIQGSYQMCIHSDTLAKRFDLYLHSIVFFE